MKLQLDDVLPRPNRLLVLILTALVLPVAGPALAQDWSIDWHALDGGGEMMSETADQTWRLSGSLGQPDASEMIELSGGEWTLTGGFWPVNINQTNLLFRDEFEGDVVPLRHTRSVENNLTVSPVPKSATGRAPPADTNRVP